MKATCSEPACENPIQARGICGTHYARKRRTGDLPELTRTITVRYVTDVDLEAGTCTCPTCGPGVRVRLREGRPPRCRRCDGGRTTGRPSDLSDARARARRRQKYGITDEEFQIRMEAQRGLCLICQLPMAVPCVDHCHEGGHVRGVLCRDCNLGLGFFKDRPDVMRRAATYLTRYRKAA